MSQPIIASSMLGTYLAGGLGWYADSSVWVSDLQLMVPVQQGLARGNFDVWSGIETSDGVYSWTKLDAIVDACVAAGVELLLTMPISSSWNLPVGTVCPTTLLGTSVGCTHFPCTNATQITDFYTQVAARYAGRIKYYEIWNEPDHPFFWKAQLNPVAAEYVLFLKTASEAIKAADPAAFIINGAPAWPQGPTPTLSGLGVTNNWEDSFIQASGLQYIDAFNAHIYPAFATFAGTMDSLSTKFTTAGHGSKEIWITETSTTGSYFDTTPSGYNGYSQALIDAEEYSKAKWLVQNYTYYFSHANAGRIFWHTMRNPGADVSVNEYQFGLKRYDGTTLPAYTAHQTWSSRMVGCRFLRDDSSGNRKSYVYHNEGNGSQTHVHWMTTGSGSVTLPRGARATQTTIYGTETALAPGSSVTVTTEPIYITMGASSSNNIKKLLELDDSKEI